jgi:uncharacterized LabA/DUF88 family protein
MRVGIFVDLANMYYCCSKKFGGKKLDYKKYIDYIAETIGDIGRATAYGAQKSSEAKGFITCLKYIGFEVKYKQPQTITIGGKDIQRVDWNVGIALDVVRTLDRLDLVVLGSSDPNIVPLVEFIQERGLACAVISCGIHKELKRRATTWVEIDEAFLEATT